MRGYSRKLTQVESYLRIAAIRAATDINDIGFANKSMTNDAVDLSIADEISDKLRILMKTDSLFINNRIQA